MQFREVQKARPGANGATIAVNKQGAALSIPLALLKEAGFADATPVRILYGEEGRRRCIQLVSDPEGKFRLSPRKAVSLLQAPELTPKAKIDKKQSLAHSEPGGGKIIFDLPAGWDLARKDVLA
ncbi:MULTISPECIES: hypothetical protein [Brevundimonas]|jgi:hypothetical protein|uniref:Uncharacterized protein n=1 Tax=viral metagenome TaxID=1070528 RepID=A0A6H1ZLY7_9ZZZZ|nr:MULTISPECIES: hypothetical protein [Brevundimonas]MBU1384799.1 hypothetical protein [Alphaproteobacteria bacterium]MBU2272002.1 hypothetical protein [Alphaproteobacteria bacterium]MBU2419547.1 hypothetical protein [Alphaproteobacteria bacterium]MRL68974.1 hypothetical protein [Brevundimonas sp. SPF441]|tara:strand:+ start:9919 stop:10290 length:372 start_codon:yes stop_codon:yes gene_type:complete